MRRFFLLSMTALLIPMALAFAFSGGPSAGLANDPPNMNNCTQCHASFGLNSGSGVLALNTDFITYNPGETYTLEVELIDPDASRWGFQIIAKDESNANAGSFVITDGDNTQSNNGYVNHTSAGTANGTSGSNSWTMDWTAPESGTGDVTFYFVGNAANGNFSTSGDHIYATAASFEEFVDDVDEDLAFGMPSEWAVGSVYPNPFNNQVNVVIDAAGRASTTVEVYDILGRRVATLFSGTMAPGQHTLNWQPQGAAGLYFLHASNTSGWSQVRKLQYLK